MHQPASIWVLATTLCWQPCCRIISPNEKHDATTSVEWEDSNSSTPYTPHLGIPAQCFCIGVRATSTRTMYGGLVAFVTRPKWLHQVVSIVSYCTLLRRIWHFRWTSGHRFYQGLTYRPLWEYVQVSFLSTYWPPSITISWRRISVTSSTV